MVQTPVGSPRSRSCQAGDFGFGKVHDRLGASSMASSGLAPLRADFALFFTANAQTGALTVVEMETARRAIVTGTQRSLLSVLLATHSGECSDVRDKLYAVLNLASDYDLGDDIDSFGPDYHLSPKEVFTRFARWSVERGNLDILSCKTNAESKAIKERP